METSIVYWGYIGIMENKMETTIAGIRGWLPEGLFAKGGAGCGLEGAGGVVVVVVIQLRSHTACIERCPVTLVTLLGHVISHVLSPLLFLKHYMGIKERKWKLL